MELGNMVFGNSRGSYSLERGMGFEEELSRLFDAYAPTRDTSWREYGAEFENDTFSVFPYYWGDCTCGFDALTFSEKHRQACYQTELSTEKLANGWTENQYGWLDSPKDKKHDEYQTIERKIMKHLCRKYGLDYPFGCAVHCTCDLHERYEMWLKEVGYENEHRKECLLVRPNFLHKKSGYEIQWYKYPLRDSYSNKEISLTDFKEIIDDCIKSLKTMTPNTPDV